MEINFGKRLRTTKGFTLIELLVVIAIIAILAAILFPVFAQVREKGRQAADLSNLKQIGLAFSQYKQDFDEHYPFSVTERYSPQGFYAGGSNPSCASPSYVGTAAQAAGYSIRGLLNPYVKSNGVWHDPSQTVAWAWDGPSAYTDTETAATDGLNATKNAWFLTDYGFNFDEGVWADTGSGNNGYGQSIAVGPQSGCVTHAAQFATGVLKGVGFNGLTTDAAITSPSTFILGADTQRDLKTVSRGSVIPQPALAADGKRIDFTQGVVPLDASQAAVALRHAGGADFLYADGHAKWKRPEQTWKSATSNDWLRVQ